MDTVTPIAALVPHHGAMVLLDRVESWDADGVLCRAISHRDAGNPLRRGGRIAAVCGVEYALQAAALHGALRDGGVAQRAGYVAALREVVLHVDWLDDPALGDLRVLAGLERQEAGGIVYRLEVQSASGTPLLSGRASIALPSTDGPP